MIKVMRSVEYAAREIKGEVGRLDWSEILKGFECNAKEFGFYQQRVWATVRGHHRRWM